RLADARGLATLPYIAARLRAPDGCPWDRDQTWQTLKPHLLEEAHEAVSALDAGEPDAVAEELGDLLLLITMLAGIGEEAELLDLPRILETVNGKLIRRHPHVFGALKLASSDQVNQQWERIKAGERATETSVLDGVPDAMPALIASQVMQRKAAALGFDWPDVQGVIAKVEEELGEAQRATTPEERLEEMGDLLFALVSLCRHLSLDAEEALRRANVKFRARFVAVEQLAHARNEDLSSLDAAALDALWQQAKAAQRG
ncbi:MAG TPA: nucleoside triphosphate pyrophosphohydrolase, partial [Chloroflexota bacterium]|nr:nucleoside triphosphate pyrophosphohydrolase [Chloroflexota bacterium]